MGHHDLRLAKSWENLAEELSKEGDPDKVVDLASELINALDEQCTGPAWAEKRPKPNKRLDKAG
jgi:hypothetical protein